MDQQDLQELESRCIQENLPECTAACPLHVDARAFVIQVAEGKWVEARRVLDRSMPFPDILGRICDAPCMDKCVRGRVGDPIRINSLESACVGQATQKPRVQILRVREKGVAVVGSGLSSLTAAWDLVRKGYHVGLFDPTDQPGIGLLKASEGRLPQQTIQEAIDLLAGLGVAIHLKTNLRSQQNLDRLLVEHDAVYLGLDAQDEAEGAQGRHLLGGMDIQPLVQSTRREAVFAGGMPRPDGTISPVRDAAEGRWAATSIDRFLQGASLSAGREKEWPCTTRLYTNLEGVQPLPAVPPKDSPEGIHREGGRGRGPALPPLRVSGVREGLCLSGRVSGPIRRNTPGRSTTTSPLSWARGRPIDSSTPAASAACAKRSVRRVSRCRTSACRPARAWSAEARCRLLRMNSPCRTWPSARATGLPWHVMNLGHAASAHAFFPGCQLSASSPRQVQQAYDHLRKNLPGGVGLILGCCGAPARWAGREEEFQSVVDRFRERWADLGSPTLVLACSSCYSVFRKILPEIPIVSLWQVLEQGGLPVTVGSGVKGPVSVHDPCTSRTESEVQQAVRTLLHRMEVRVEELQLSREKTECCGFGGLMQNANPTLAKRVIRRRAEESALDYLTYCAMCRDNLASTGKRTLHLLDLIFPDPEGADAASRERPGWSERQENRARLKDVLLREVWGEEVGEVEEHRKIVLHMEPELQVRLEERRILHEDVQRVIHHAEKTGEKLVHQETGQLKASFKPYKVTFWVEYSLCGEGYRVHNAYAHRMEVEGGTLS